MAEAEDGRGVVTERVRELVEALRAHPAIQRFLAVERRFRTDAELARMQAGMRWNHERVQRAEREGRHDARLFQEVREGQARLRQHPLIVEFLGAREEAQQLLRETNAAMSEILGVDVGGSGARAGAC